MRTQDLDEAIEAVTKVYCPHTVEVIGRGPGIDVRLDVRQPTFQPLVELSYDAPVMIDAGNCSRLFVMMHCTRGSAFTVQGGRSAEWQQGQTLPFSAGFETKLWFDSAFVQKGVRLDMEKLEALCARWLGRPLEQPLPIRPPSVLRGIGAGLAAFLGLPAIERGKPSGSFAGGQDRLRRVPAGAAAASAST